MENSKIGLHVTNLPIIKTKEDSKIDEGISSIKKPISLSHIDEIANKMAANND